MYLRNVKSWLLNEDIPAEGVERSALATLESNEGWRLEHTPVVETDYSSNELAGLVAERHQVSA